jgi:hypothetical protein
MQRQNPQPWMNYVDVADIDATIETATKLGATVALPRTPVPGVGAVAAIIESAGQYLRAVGAETRTHIHNLKADTPLIRSGLMGPVFGQPYVPSGQVDPARVNVLSAADAWQTSGPLLTCE